jgi:hypothetical protein
MKRFVIPVTLITGLLLVGISEIKAATSPAKPAPTQSMPKVASTLAKPPFPISNGFSRGLQTVTGVRFITGKIAEGAIAKELTPQFQRRPKVKLKLYSAGDLAAGKLKQITVSGQHLVLGVPFTQLTLTSQDPIWLKLASKPRLRMPVRASFEGLLTEADLNAMLKAQPTKLKIKLPAFGEQTLLALNPTVQLDNNTLKLNTRLSVPGGSLDTALPLAMEGQLRPNAERNRLVWQNLKLSSSAFNSPDLMAQFVEDQFGKVISFASQQVNGHPLQVRIMESQIDNHVWRIRADMTLLPPKP